MSRVMLKLKHPITEFELDVDENSLQFLWIPVEERLPENRNTVIATVNGVVCVAFYGNYTWREVETYSVFYPTHWMPLPQPPEEV